MKFVNLATKGIKNYFKNGTSNGSVINANNKDTVNEISLSPVEIKE